MVITIAPFAQGMISGMCLGVTVTLLAIFVLYKISTIQKKGDKDDTGSTDESRQARADLN
jgi:hypothetical protein